MLTHHYIETVFESLATALEHGIIDDWSVKGGSFVIHHSDERVTVAQRKAAAYVAELLRPHVESEQPRVSLETEKVSRPSAQPAHWLRLAIS